jgi:hypothetical protein
MNETEALKRQLAKYKALRVVIPVATICSIVLLYMLMVFLPKKYYTNIKNTYTKESATVTAVEEPKSKAANSQHKIRLGKGNYTGYTDYDFTITQKITVSYGGSNTKTFKVVAYDTTLKYDPSEAAIADFEDRYAYVEGDSLTVYYNASNPSKCYTADKISERVEDSPYDLIYWVLAFIIFVAGVCFMVSAIGSVKRLSEHDLQE